MTDETESPVAQRIRQRMKEVGMKQAALARAIGVDKTTMWKYLSGSLGLEKKLLAIARALKTDPTWLEFGGDAPVGDEHTDIIETFIREMRDSLKITAPEATYLRAFPHHRVTPGALLDALHVARRGLSPEDTARGIAKTQEVRAKGDALNVPKRRQR